MGIVTISPKNLPGKILPDITHTAPGVRPLLTELCKSVESRSMQYFNRKSMELEKNLPVTVKNFQNLHWMGIWGIGLGKWREIGWS